MATRPQPAKRKSVYNLNWPMTMDPVAIEMHMIQKGGQYTKQDGTLAGEGLFHHYRELQKLLWPEEDHHRWSDLILKTLVEEEISVLMGASDTGKTWSMSKYMLCDWWCFPNNTLWMVTSTELRGAELRIWGALKQLFNKARDRYPWLPGQVLESYHAITTEKISDDQSKGRLLTKGLIFIPCKKGNTYVGFGSFIGVKPVRGGRLRHAGDEVSVMNHSFLDAYSNWYGKPEFKGIMSGNPISPDDPLCVAGEPVEGWTQWRDTGKTQTWRSKWYNAMVVCLDGRDSPNFDYPASDKTHFPYLIGPKKIESVKKVHGETSWQFSNQCVGKPRSTNAVRRIITRELCEQYSAFEEVMWLDGKRTAVAGLDAAYGGLGGDRCVLQWGEFGKDVEDRTVIALHEPVIVPINILLPVMPEHQIAMFCKTFAEEHGIPARNFFFDARASLAMAFAQLWSTDVEVVDFGGPASNRVVSADTYIWDGDTRTRRLQKCNELYSKFVTELWWSIYYIIISHQMRQLPRESSEELCKREWRYSRNNKIEVETKAEMKERTTYSPDLADAVAICCEGAKRRGFIIDTQPATNPEDEDDSWKEDITAIANRINRSSTLVKV